MRVRHDANLPLALEALERRRMLAAELVADINPDPTGMWPTGMTNVNGTLFFMADDGVHGAELWKSDGTAAGTVMIRDIRPGAAGSGPSELTPINNTLYFTAEDGTHFRQLWKSDGTAAGTVMVAQTGIGFSSSPSGLVAVGGTLYFAAYQPELGRELWRSNGHASNTVLVREIIPGFQGAKPEDLVNVNGTLFFTADDGTRGRELWRSNGTAAGTVLVRDINPWTNMMPQGLSPDLFAFGGALYCTADDGSRGVELWRSDGTAGGTAIVRDVAPGRADSFPNTFTPAGDTLFFRATTDANGIELWKTQGTNPSTALVRDVRPGPESSWPFALAGVGATFFFAADDGTAGAELWRSDGTPGNTRLVADIRGGPEGGLHGGGGSIAGVGATVFFSANDGAAGHELWMSNGFGAGTVRVQDILPGSPGSSPIQLVDVNGSLFFIANDGVHGRELWVLRPDVAPPRVSTGMMEFESALAVRLRFSEPIDGGTLSPSDLDIIRVANGQAFSAESVVLTDNNTSATFALPPTLPDGDYAFALPAGSITDVVGNTSTEEFRLEGPAVFVLAGDANRDRRVNLADFNTLAANFGQSGRTFSQGDFNYDGSVNLEDFNILAGQFGAMVAPGTIRTGGVPNYQADDDEDSMGWIA